MGACRDRNVNSALSWIQTNMSQTWKGDNGESDDKRDGSEYTVLTYVHSRE